MASPPSNNNNNDRLRDILDKAASNRSERLQAAAATAPTPPDLTGFFERYASKKKPTVAQSASPRRHSPSESPQPKLLPPLHAAPRAPSSEPSRGTASRGPPPLLEGRGHQHQQYEDLTAAVAFHDAQVTAAVTAVISSLEAELEAAGGAGSLAAMDRWRLHEDAAKSALYVQGNAATRRVVMWAFQEFGAVVGELEGEIEALRSSCRRAEAEERASSAVVRSLQAKLAGLEGSLQEQAKSTALQRSLDICELARSELEQHLAVARSEIAGLHALSRTTLGELLAVQHAKGAADEADQHSSSGRSTEGRGGPAATPTTSTTRYGHLEALEARCAALEYRNIALAQEVARYKVAVPHLAGRPSPDRGLRLDGREEAARKEVDEAGYVTLTPRPESQTVRDVFNWGSEACPTTCHELLPAMCEAHRNLRLQLAAMRQRATTGGIEEEETPLTP